MIRQEKRSFSRENGCFESPPTANHEATSGIKSQFQTMQRTEVSPVICNGDAISSEPSINAVKRLARVPGKPRQGTRELTWMVLCNAQLKNHIHCYSTVGPHKDRINFDA